jgi:GTPase SAR1 family protein
MAYPNTNVFILCFSVVDPDSYSNILSKWIPELNRMYLHFSMTDFHINEHLGYAPRVPIVLVGTKLDLRNDPSTLEQLSEKNQRPITQSQGEYLARICSAKVYLECSSMLNFNVRNVFEQAIQIHNFHEQRSRHGINHSRRILSSKFHSCSWFGSLLCCTNGSRSSSKKNTRIKKDNQNRYTM